jgi:hypothetical protein
MAEDLPQPFKPLFEREEVLFLGVYPDGHYDLVEKRGSPPYQVDVAGGDGVERPRENGYAHAEGIVGPRKNKKRWRNAPPLFLFIMLF